MCFFVTFQRRVIRQVKKKLKQKGDSYVARNGRNAAINLSLMQLKELWGRR